MATLQYQSLDNALAQFEGFNTPGTISSLQNNPGNLVYNDYSKSLGAIGAGSKGIAIFPDPNTGFQAEDTLVQAYASKDYTVGQLIYAWAPPNAPGNTPAATQNYLDFVNNNLGTTSDTPLKKLATQQSGVNIPATIGGAIMNNPLINPAGTVLGLIPGFSYARVGAFLLGLILIAGGIYLFKPVQEVVHTATKAALEA